MQQLQTPGHPTSEQPAGRKPTPAELPPSNSKNSPSLRLLTKEERLEQKITLAFGFMSFIPLLLIVWALVSFVLPRSEGMTSHTVSLLVLAIIVSIFVGYSILKRTAKSVIKLVHQARALTVRQLGEAGVEVKDGEDEISDRAASLSYYFLFALFPDKSLWVVKLLPRCLFP